MSECGLLQPCPAPRGRELHSLHQEQHQLSTLPGQQVRGESGQIGGSGRPLLLVSAPCHPLLLLLSLRRPGFWGGLPSVSKGCGRGISGAHEGSTELRGMVGTLPAAILLLPTPSAPQAQPGGGGEFHLHEEMHLSQDLTPAVPFLQSRLCGTSVRAEFQRPGREGIVPGEWGGPAPPGNQADKGFSGPVNPTPASLMWAEYDGFIL